MQESMDLLEGSKPDTGGSEPVPDDTSARSQAEVTAKQKASEAFGHLLDTTGSLVHTSWHHKVFDNSRPVEGDSYKRETPAPTDEWLDLFGDYRKSLTRYATRLSFRDSVEADIYAAQCEATFKELYLKRLTNVFLKESKNMNDTVAPSQVEGTAEEEFFVAVQTLLETMCHAGKFSRRAAEGEPLITAAPALTKEFAATFDKSGDFQKFYLSNLTAKERSPVPSHSSEGTVSVVREREEDLRVRFWKTLTARFYQERLTLQSADCETQGDMLLKSLAPGPTTTQLPTAHPEAIENVFRRINRARTPSDPEFDSLGVISELSDADFPDKDESGADPDIPDSPNTLVDSPPR